MNTNIEKLSLQDKTKKVAQAGEFFLMWSWETYMNKQRSLMMHVQHSLDLGKYLLENIMEVYNQKEVHKNRRNEKKKELWAVMNLSELLEPEFSDKLMCLYLIII